VLFRSDLISFYNATARPGRVVLDRGIPDVIGYLTLCGLPVPGHLRFSAETCRYNAHVFIAPHWPDIFTQDAERRQSAQQAEATYHVMAETYASLGYTLVPLPLAPVEERVRFVLETLLRQ
jgi:predicted ATPase